MFAYYFLIYTKYSRLKSMKHYGPLLYKRRGISEVNEKHKYMQLFKEVSVVKVTVPGSAKCSLLRSV